MRITFSDTGKRFNREWIFRNLSFDFLPGEKYAITGPNGSGKSTVLQVISGSMAASAGHIRWQLKNELLQEDALFNFLSISAPYLETIEELSAFEFLSFHNKFKNFIDHISVDEIIEVIGLKSSAHKQIRYFSSGMKQRIKLAQAIFSDVPLLLLDEPCTNLDTAGIELYHQLITKYAIGKTLIVSSNDVQEYSFCKSIINVLDYK